MLLLLAILLIPLIDVSSLVFFAEAQDHSRFQSRPWLIVRLIGWSLFLVVLIVLVVIVKSQTS